MQRVKKIKKLKNYIKKINLYIHLKLELEEDQQNLTWTR